MAKTAERVADVSRPSAPAHLGVVGESEGGGLGLLSESSLARGAAARPAEAVTPQAVEAMVKQIETLAGFGVPREATLVSLTPELRKAVEAKLAFKDHERLVAQRIEIARNFDRMGIGHDSQLIGLDDATRKEIEDKLVERSRLDAFVLQGQTADAQFKMGIGFGHDDAFKTLEPELRKRVNREMSISRLLKFSGETFDVKQITDELEHLDDPAERAAVLKEYELRTGRSLQTEIHSHCDENHYYRAATDQLLSDDRTKTEERLAALAHDDPKAYAVKKKQAEEIARKLVSELSKSDPDKKAVLSSINFTESPEDIELIRQAFRAIAPEQDGLFNRLNHSLGGKDEKQAIASLDMGANRHMKQAAATLRNYSAEYAKEAREVLSKLSKHEIDEMRAHPDEYGDIIKEVQGWEVSPKDKKIIDAYINGQRDLAAGLQLSEDISGGFVGEGEVYGNMYQPGGDQKLDDTALFAKLEAMKPAERERAIAAYDAAMAGTQRTSLRDQMEKRFHRDKDNYDRDRGVALLEGRVEDAMAALAMDAIDRKGTHLDDLEHALSDPNLDPKLAESGDPELVKAHQAALDRRAKIEKAFERYGKGTLRALAYDEDKLAAGKDNRVAFDDILGTGSVSFAVKMQRAMDDGDTEKARELILKASDDEIAQARAIFPSLEAKQGFDERVRLTWGPTKTEMVAKGGFWGGYHYKEVVDEKGDKTGTYIQMAAVLEKGSRAKWSPQERAQVDRQAHDADRDDPSRAERNGDTWAGSHYDYAIRREEAAAAEGETGEEFAFHAENTDAAGESYGKQKHAETEAFINHLKLVVTIVTAIVAPELLVVLTPLMSAAAIGYKEAKLGKHYEGENADIKGFYIDAALSVTSIAGEALIAARQASTVARGVAEIGSEARSAGALAREAETATQEAFAAQGQAVEAAEAIGKTAEGSAARAVAKVEEVAAKAARAHRLKLDVARIAADNVARGVADGKSWDEILKSVALGELQFGASQATAKLLGGALARLKGGGAAMELGKSTIMAGAQSATALPFDAAMSGSDDFLRMFMERAANEGASGAHGVVREHMAGPHGSPHASVPEGVHNPAPQSPRKTDEPPPRRAPAHAEEPEGRTAIQRRIDDSTVEHGGSYSEEMAKLKAFYAQQEREGRKVSTVSRTDVEQFRDVEGAIPGKTKGFTKQPLFHQDGRPFGAEGQTHYDVREYSHGVTAIEVRVHLEGDATPEEMARVKSQTLANVDKYYNHKENIVKNSAGQESRLHVEVVFVDEPAAAHATVKVVSGEGRSDQLTWYADELGIQYAHEIAHHIGLGDEYIDERVVRRKDYLAPDVAPHDDSLLGYYLITDPDDPTRKIAHPNASLKPRHMEVLSKHINEQRAADGYGPGGKGKRKPAAPKALAAPKDEAVAVLADGTKVAIPRRQSSTEEDDLGARATRDLAEKEKAWEALTDDQKRDPTNPTVRAVNDARTLVRALEDPEAPLVDEQKQFEEATAAAQERARAEAAKKPPESRPLPDAEERQAKTEAEAAVQRRADEQNAAQRDAIVDDERQLFRLRRDRNEASDAESQRRLDAEIGAVEKRLADNQAAVKARAAEVARKYREDQETREAQELAGREAARKVREAGEAEAKAQRDAEEADRAARAEAERAAKDEKARAAAEKLEKDKLEALDPKERKLREEAAAAEADLAQKEQDWERLSEKEKRNPQNATVRARNDAWTRANALKNPEAPFVDAQKEFEAETAAATARAQREADAKPPEIKALPDAEERQARADAQAAADREAGERQAAQRQAIEDDEKELFRLRRGRGEAEGADAQKAVDGEIAKVEARLTENKAAVQARADEVARKYQEDQQAREAQRKAGEEAARKVKEEQEAIAAAERAEEEKAQAARAREEQAARDAKEAEQQAAAQKLEEDRVAAMSPGDRAVYELTKKAKADLAVKKAAVDALTEAEQRDPQNPTMQAYHAAWTLANGLENPEKTVVHAQAEHEAAAAEIKRRAEWEARVARESEVRVDPEAAARHARAEAELKAATAAAEESAARREAIADDKAKLRELEELQGKVVERLELAQADGNELGADDHRARLDELKAERREIEARVAKAEAEEQARTDEEVRRHQAEREAEQKKKADDADRLRKQAEEIAEKKRLQEEQDKAEADARSAAEYRKQKEASAAAEERKAKAIRDNLPEEMRDLYDSLLEKEQAHAAAEAEWAKLPPGKQRPGDPLLTKIVELADDIESLEKAVFPNGRPK